jgi:hypothetical protein
LVDEVLRSAIIVAQGEPIAVRVELTIESAVDWLLVRPEGAAPQLPASPSRTVPVPLLPVATVPELPPVASAPASPCVPLDPPEPLPLDVDVVDPLEPLDAGEPDDAPPDDALPDELPWLPDPEPPLPLDVDAPELDDAPPPSPLSKPLLEDEPLHAATSATAKQVPVA